MSTIHASITRRNLPPRCSRITNSRPNVEKRVPRTLFSTFVTYKINALGQRVQKTGAGIYAFNSSLTIDATTGQSPLARTVNFNARYVYDEQGRLIGEYAPDGKLISETVYFNDLPIATLRPKGANAGTPLGQSGTTTGNPSNGATAANANNVGNNSTTNRVNVEVFYVHADHLGTPRTVTRSTIATGANAPSSATANSPGAINKAVWRWDSDPFGTSLGNSTPNENPQLITGTVTVQQAGTFRQNMRFPGQLADGESAKYYNYFRDYDPAIGRYTTSDPIGLNGGSSTYGYVAQAPIVFVDLKGLYICYYSLSSGVLECSPNDPRNPPYSSSGWHSGQGPCKDNPDCAKTKDKGPTPPLTCYRIAPKKKPEVGDPDRFRHPLIPIDPGFVRPRDALQIHSCGSRARDGCSQGCIVNTDSIVSQFSDIISRERDNIICVSY